MTRLTDWLNALPYFFGSSSFGTELLTWLIVPFLIFVARVLDVTLMTMRIIFVSRGKRFIAPALGFFEVLIWLLAILLPGAIQKPLFQWTKSARPAKASFPRKAPAREITSTY